MGGAQQGGRSVAVNGHQRSIRPVATSAHAAEETPGILAVQRDRRMTEQQGLHGLETTQPLVFAHGFQGVERHRVPDIETAGGGSTQRAQVGATTQRLADVFGQRPDVGSLAAGHSHFNSRLRFFHKVKSQIQLMNHDLAGVPLDLHAGAGVFVQCLAVLLQCAVHRRHLPDRSCETQGHGGQIGRRDLDRSLPHDFALGIAGAGLDAQLGDRFIGLVRIQVQLTELGGSTEAQRQDTGGQRIERAGMACLLGAQQPFGLLQGLVAGETQRLVEQQHPMHRAPLHPGAWRLHVQSSLLEREATAWAISAFMSAARSVVRS